MDPPLYTRFGVQTPAKKKKMTGKYGPVASLTKLLVSSPPDMCQKENSK